MTWIYKRTWNPQHIPNNLISKSQMLISMFGCPNGHSLAFRKRMSWLLCRATCCMRCGNPSPSMRGMGISQRSSGEVQFDLPNVDRLVVLKRCLKPMTSYLLWPPRKICQAVMWACLRMEPSMVDPLPTKIPHDPAATFGGNASGTFC